MGSTTSYLCDLGQVICLALVSTGKNANNNIYQKFVVYLNEIKKVKSLAEGLMYIKSSSSRISPITAIVVALLNTSFTEGEGDTSSQTENFHFCLNMHLAKNAKPKKF